MHHITVDTITDLKGGGYAHLQKATFTAKVTTYSNEDRTPGASSVHQLILPEHRQASIYRMDFKDQATRMGDMQGRSCWLQFQCVPTPMRNGEDGFLVQDVVEALGHADSFYKTCTIYGDQPNIYKAKMSRDGHTIKDMRKRGPHYHNHMKPLPRDHVIPAS